MAHAKPAPPPLEHVKISSYSAVAKSEWVSVSAVRKHSRKKVIITCQFAAGITEEQPLQVIQYIDKLDGDNQLAVVLLVYYMQDIYKFYTVAENEHRVVDYMLVGVYALLITCK